MMNKTQSARVHLIRFLFLLPLLVVVLLAFRNSTQTHHQSLRALVTDTVPTAEKVPPGWKDLETIDVNEEGKVIVRLKDKKVEKYDLSNIKEREAFEKKYGPVPTPPPPPPAPLAPISRELPLEPLAPISRELPLEPLAPISKELPAAPEAPKKPAAPGVVVEKVEITETEEDPGVPVTAPVPPPPPPPPAPQDCYNNKGFCITLVDNRGEAIVIVKDKDNKIVQAVSLYEWNKDKKYEEKYGAAPTHQILVYPKVVTGYRSTQVSVGEASEIKPGEVVKIKPVGAKVVSPGGNLIRVAPTNKVIVTPSNQIMVVRVARPPVEAKTVTNIKLTAPKPVVEDKKTELINLTPVDKPATADKKPILINLTPVGKPAAEAKEATERKVNREGEKPQPAAPSKEQ